MAGFNVKLPKAKVPAPRVNGYIVHMNAELVNSQGRRVTIRDVMLHHLVFHRRRESSRAQRVLEPARRGVLRDR